MSWLLIYSLFYNAENAYFWQQQASGKNIFCGTSNLFPSLSQLPPIVDISCHDVSGLYLHIVMNFGQILAVLICCF